MGFAAGIYCGSILEEKLAFGKILIQVITNEEKGILLCTTLREKGLGVTTMKAEGITDQKKVLMIYTNRRGSNKVIEDIQAIDSTAVIVRNDISSMTGGHMPKVGGLLK